MRKITAVLAIGICLVVFAAAGPARATDVLQAKEFQVTFDANGHSTPIVGHDSIGDLIVYTQYSVLYGYAHNASLYYQRVANGAVTGAPVTVADSPENQWLNDVSGDYIVYTISPAVGQLGNIELYQIGASQSRPLTSSGRAWSPKIYGDVVVWIEYTPSGAGQVAMYRISSGVPVMSTLMAGPIPSALEAAIGDRLIVWSQLVNNQYDLAAYDMQKGLFLMVANNPAVNETTPSTEGAWIAYEVATPAGTTGQAIKAINIDTGEIRTIVDNGANNVRPCISGNLISYESNVSGKSQIYVYRIQQGDTIQVTSGTYNEHLNNLKGNLVTYVDNRNGNDGVFVSTLSFNIPPIANAGPNQTVHEGSLVTLDGSGSSDPSGFVPLTYAWSFSSVPTGSTASLSDPTSVHPTFTVDLTGDYVVQLVVTNSQRIKSSPATVTISTYNTPPVADPGPDQAITLIGALVHLDGSQSYDVDGDPLTYSWTIITKPTTSNATLTGGNTPTPTFVADVHGTYIIQLVVSDPWVSSDLKAVTVSFTNIAPVANAGTSQSARVDELVILNGSGSSDANGDPLTFRWAITSFPTGSGATIGNPFAMITTFVPDLVGTYVIQLVVNDGLLDSAPSTTQVQVVANPTVPIEAIQDVQASIASLNPGVFKNANMQKTFNNKLNAVIADIEAGNYANALDKLQHDILGKTDGCANAGAPDSNDWIKDCGSQAQVYPLILKVIEILRGL
jgi:hypothetical protein